MTIPDRIVRFSSLVRMASTPPDGTAIFVTEVQGSTYDFSRTFFRAEKALVVASIA